MKKRLCPWISALLALLMLFSSVALLSACGSGEDTNVPTGTADGSAFRREPPRRIIASTAWITTDVSSASTPAPTWPV